MQEIKGAPLYHHTGGHHAYDLVFQLISFHVHSNFLSKVEEAAGKNGAK